MTIATIPRALISAHWLANNLEADNLVVMDATMKPINPASLSATPAQPLRIKNARRFDFDSRICDRANPLPHMMPSPADFTREMQALGINEDSVIVVYDNIGLFSSPRAWWMLRSMGHDQVAVLDGGLPAWLENNFPTEPLAAADDHARPGNFSAKPRANSFCDAERVRLALTESTAHVVDARSAGRFHGEEPEPRAGLKTGHMPGAINLPFSKTQRDGLMLPPAELRELFTAIAHPEQPLIFSCGSGVTACINALAAELAGLTRVSVYDGSWSEWGDVRANFPVAAT